tara:strand:- start:575 stop:964 length:390 start_codon:yes stop_codon:yes gene_type:complete
MKKRIVDILVVIAMAIIANYPLYKSLQDTMKEADVIIQAVQAEIISWQEDLDNVKHHVDVLNVDIHNAINKSMDKTQNILKKLQTLEDQNDVFQNKIDRFSGEVDTLEEKLYRAVKGKFKQPIPGLPGF